MKRKSNSIGLLITIILIVGIFLKFYVIGNAVNTDSVYFEKIEVSPYYLKLTGNTSNSGLTFSRFEMRYAKKSAYIKLIYTLPSFINKSGKFDIHQGEYLENVETLYLEGNDENDKKIIWKK